MNIETAFYILVGIYIGSMITGIIFNIKLRNARKDNDRFVQQAKKRLNEVHDEYQARHNQLRKDLGLPIIPMN